MNRSGRIEDLEAIFRAAVNRVDPGAIIREHLTYDGRVLTLRDRGRILEFRKENFDRILVLGAGKASARMALALEEILGEDISDSLVVVKYGHTENTRRIRLFESGHPVPDENSVLGAEKAAELCRGADARTLVINLISGGGSALLALPYRDDTIRLTLEDKQAVTRSLMDCGATIQEINCIRKHLSGIKGGRMARMLYPATTLNLILSDVVGDRLDSIASGLTVGDETTFAQAAAILERYGIRSSLPPEAEKLISAGLRGEVPESPRKDDPVFRNSHQLLLGSNRNALDAAAEEAAARGYAPRILSSQITGEAREAACFYMGIARDLGKYEPAENLPVCLIAGGETTVTIRGKGKGGRNQEMALSALAEMDKFPEESRNITFLSAGTDGNDGPTDAAGAFASSEILEEAVAAGLEIAPYLADNDSYRFFDPLGRLLKTGPTNTNVCDIQLILIHRPEV